MMTNLVCLYFQPPAGQPTETNANNVITHPLFGVDPNQNQNGYGDLSGGQYGTSSNAAYQGTYMTPQLPPQQQQQMAHQLPPTGFPSQTQSFQTQLPTAQPTQFSQQPAQQPIANPEPVKQKPPLPEEFIYLQTVFNELRTQCCNATNNPVSSHINQSMTFIPEEFSRIFVLIFHLFFV